MHSVWGGRHACAACCQGVRGRASLPDKSCASDGAEGTHLTLWRASDTRRVAAREAPLVCATVCGMPQGRDPTHTLPHTLSQHASPTYTLNLARDTWHATEPLSASHVLAILPPGHLPSSAPQLLAPCGCQFQQASLRLAAASSERDTNPRPNHSTTKATPPPKPICCFTACGSLRPRVSSCPDVCAGRRDQDALGMWMAAATGCRRHGERQVLR